MTKTKIIAIVAEKPSVARDLARVVGADLNHRGHYSGNGYVVTWAIGHLVTLPEPGAIKAEWKKWNLDHLPLLPSKWPLTPVEKTIDQLEIVQKILHYCDEVICATDAGREGELIFRYLYEYVGLKKKVQRLWISSLTTPAIEAGLKNLKSAQCYDSLADAARARSRADWLFGMNFSRAYAMTSQQQFFVGRVQTPTLAMVVKRDLEIANFVTEKYLVIEGHFSLPMALEDDFFSGQYIGEKNQIESILKPKEKRFRLEEKNSLISPLIKQLSSAPALVEKLDGQTNSWPAPLFYDLTELQRHAHRLFGFSAAETLSIAQGLYENHKLISYPRTDSRHLSSTVASTLPAIVAVIRVPYESLLNFNDQVGLTSLPKRFVDDLKVTDHHAIIPTTTSVDDVHLSLDENKIYDLICRRLLMAWMPDQITKSTTVIVRVGEQSLFRALGNLEIQRGWKVLELKLGEKNLSENQLPHLQIGTILKNKKIQMVEKKTSPPAKLNDASLLTGMETAGRDLEEKELASVMKNSGIGTPATRAQTIETLIARGYLARQNKSLIATTLGHQLIATVHENIKSPILTAQWEKKLHDIQNEKLSFNEFMKNIEAEISSQVRLILQKTPTPTIPIANPGKVFSPLKQFEQLEQILKQLFGLKSFRPGQEKVCQHLVHGEDVLLVMPTGAGKSLCYQLPGIARGGTTLVIGPLIALMDDQVSSLLARGLRAASIHSGKSREESRAVCRQYLAGELDFLFIAPERLAVPSFPELLVRRPPTLIAIDEAHCISQWGHDFRPDYRLLGERLQSLKSMGGAPVIAMTATATPIVQKDICEQLGLTKAHQVIEGFRRTNIAIEFMELTPKDRPATILALLKNPAKLPAIIYAPTRKKTEELCTFLKNKKNQKTFKVEPYHAGMSSDRREEVQNLFQTGKIDVMVATIAFGMGIDKANIRTVIHAALPSSVEGYYQEIGRAGRDGLASEAYLLHSYGDIKTHEYFFHLNYPELADLQAIYAKLSTTAKTKDQIQYHLRSMDEAHFENGLRQLALHRGAVITPDDQLIKGKAGWEKTYQTQKNWKSLQIQKMQSFTSMIKCRMVCLVEHFGDQKDLGENCLLCDRCRPRINSQNHVSLSLKENEAEISNCLLGLLKTENQLAAGRLFESLNAYFPQLKRAQYEVIVNLLRQTGELEVLEKSFVKAGKDIHYRQMALTSLGRQNSTMLAVKTKTKPKIKSKTKTKLKKKSRYSHWKIKKKIPQENVFETS